MKKVLSFISLILILSFRLFAQQAPNSSFETWTNGEPDHWKTSNQNIPILGSIIMVAKDLTDPEQGIASAKLTVVTKTILFVGTYTIPGVLTLGKLNIDIAAQTASVTGGTPFTARPVKLTGYLKYLPVNNDFCAMGWGLSKWNNGTRDTIGFGAISISATLNSWTYFEIPINDLLAETPDTLNILILNSNPLDKVNHTGTTMWVDNLSFDYGTVGIEGVTFTKELTIYAKPDARQLVLSSHFAKQEKLNISLLNMAGIECRQWNRTMQLSTEYLDINNLQPGTYAIRISSGNRLVDSRKITILK